jgi:hypothetical protein
VSFVAITLCVASQRVFKIVVYFVIDSVLKLLIHPRILLTTLFFPLVGMGTRKIQKDAKIRAEYCQYNSEARTETSCDATRVGWMLRNCAGNLKKLWYFVGSSIANMEG